MQRSETKTKTIAKGSKSKIPVCDTALQAASPLQPSTGRRWLRRTSSVRHQLSLVVTLSPSRTISFIIPFTIDKTERLFWASTTTPRPT